MRYNLTTSTVIVNIFFLVFRLVAAACGFRGVSFVDPQLALLHQVAEVVQVLLDLFVRRHVAVLHQQLHLRSANSSLQKPNSADAVTYM